MQALRKLILPTLVAACGGLSACTTTTPGGTTQSLAPGASQEFAAETGSAGSAEDGARSLAYEVERAGAKPEAAGEKALPDETAALAPADGAAQAAESELPLTAMLPERKPSPLAVRQAGGKPRAGQVQVASLDPSIGVADERFGEAGGMLQAAPVETMKGGRLVDDSGEVAHSKPAPEGRVGPARVAARSTELDQLIAHYSNYYGVPEKLVRHVAKRESTLNPGAANGPYVGLMQISVPTARGMGYRGNRSGLLDAETNLKYAVRYLRGAYVVARGNHEKADRLYRTGYYYHAKRAGLLDATGVGRDRKKRSRF